MGHIGPDSTGKVGKTWIMIAKYRGLLYIPFIPIFNYWRMKCDSQTKLPSLPVEDQE